MSRVIYFDMRPDYYAFFTNYLLTIQTSRYIVYLKAYDRFTGPEITDKWNRNPRLKGL